MKMLSDTSTIQEDIIGAIEVLEIRMRDAERSVRHSNRRIDRLRELTNEVEKKFERAIKEFEEKLDVINRDI